VNHRILARLGGNSNAMYKQEQEVVEIIVKEQKNFLQYIRRRNYILAGQWSGNPVPAAFGTCGYGKHGDHAKKYYKMQKREHHQLWWENEGKEAFEKYIEKENTGANCDAGKK